jgi:hypothetical protein
VKFQNPLPRVGIKPDPMFDLWVASMPMDSWARYDLSACRLGWDAAKEANARLCDASTAIPEIAYGESYMDGWAKACDYLANLIRGIKRG